MAPLTFVIPLAPPNCKPTAVVQVPIPTLPLVTINLSCGVVVPTPTLPANVAVVPEALKVVAPEIVLAVLPLCVYPPLVVIPVEALIAPALLTVNAFAPTDNWAVGAQVPIPTLPNTASLPSGVVVPIPKLSVIVVKRTVVPSSVKPPAAAIPVSAEPSPLNAVARTVPATSTAVPGVIVPTPTLPFNTLNAVPALGVVHVPIPTDPSTANFVWAVVVPIPKLPLAVMSPV